MRLRCSAMSGANENAYAEVIAELERTGERLTDLALSRLREALEDGGASAATEERQVTKARRAVEKAIRDLQAIAPPADDW